MRKGSQIGSEDRLGPRPYWGDSDERISLGWGFRTALQPCCNFPKGRGWPDRSIFSLTQSGTTTALNSSCTDMPLSLASADIVLNGSSRIDSMNFAIADKPRLFFPVGGYITIYTPSTLVAKNSYDLARLVWQLRPFCIL